MSGLAQPVSATGAEADRNANLRRLEGCPRPHIFQHEAARSATGGPSQWRCSRCGGVVGGKEQFWYQSGLFDARREAGGR